MFAGKGVVLNPVFPAGAGMIRCVMGGKFESLSVPRRRGDDPVYDTDTDVTTLCSPQAQG